MRIALPASAPLRALALAAGCLLTSCTVVVEDRPPAPSPGPICTREYDPVCARRGGDRQTFANACLAEAAGYRVVRRGECRGAGGGGGGGGGAFCTREYAPVCARRGDRFRTFGNACEAEAANWRIVANRPC